MMIRKLILSLCAAWILSVPLSANEGMWLPNLLKKLNEAEMKDLGMRISAEDIYSVNKGSIKDAVVHFGGGCTAEVVSSEGLLFTNHHCGYGQIQRHSTPEKNYLEKGFWAANRQEELPNQGLTATFIVRIEDVTSAALEGVTSAMDAKARQSQIDKNLARIKESTNKQSYEDITIRPFYEGNEYYLFVTATYRDVRLVGTPPSFIGKYGADTDNWVWPRHTGDFAVFRIYAGANNEPADYSPDNKPYQPRHFLPVSLTGIKENDFLMVFGFPGRTDQYLPSAAINQVQNVLNPARVEIRDRALTIIDAAMRKDPNVKIQYASKQSRISNYWKKWRGESMGLAKSNAIQARQNYERDFNRRVSKNPKWSAYSGMTAQFNKLYEAVNPYAYAREVYMETVLRTPEITRLAGTMQAILDVHAQTGEQAYTERRNRAAASMATYFRDYQSGIDKAVFASMMDYYATQMQKEYIPAYMQQLMTQYEGDWTRIAEVLFSQTQLAEADKVNYLLTLDAPTLQAVLDKDPVYILNRELKKVSDEQINPEYNRLIDSINGLKRDFLRAQREVFSDRKFYPDANSTMRMSYGKVEGYKPRDGVYFEPFTTIDGVMAKYVPGDYEFDLDERFKELYERKDYGRYAADGTLPINFIGSIHTTGGNSGSPVLNGDGHLVGLLFDGSWEGVMSDIYYNPDLVRSIMVDIRYVLWVIDKYAGATHLLDEMKVVETAPAAPAKKPGKK